MIVTWWGIIGTIITSMSLGTIISTCIAVGYQQRKLLFETKLVKYSNLIQAHQNTIAQYQVDKQFISELKQVELLGSDEIIRLCQELLKESNKPETRDNLVKAMKEDLNNSKSFWQELKRQRND